MSNTARQLHSIPYAALHARLTQLIAEHGKLMVQIKPGFLVPADDAHPRPSGPFGALQYFSMPGTQGCLDAYTDKIEEVLYYSESEGIFKLDRI